MGYAVYKITVEVLNRTNIKSVIQGVLGQNKMDKKIKGVIGDIEKNGKVYKAKVSILDTIDNKKEYEVEISSTTVSGLAKGDVIEGIM